MSDNLKDNLKKEGQADGGTNSSGEGDRTEDRIKDLTGKLSDKDRELQEERQKRIDLEFQGSFAPEKAKYPAAKDFEKEIRELVDKGLSTSAATAAVLSEKGKLVTAEQAQAEQNAGAGMGGSADTTGIDKEKKTVGEMTQDERLAALREEEAKGNILLS